MICPLSWNRGHAIYWHHNLLSADNLELIVTFYEDVLGWAVHREWHDIGEPKWVMLGPADSPALRLMYNVPEGSAAGPGQLENGSSGQRELYADDPHGDGLYISGAAGS